MKNIVFLSVLTTDILFISIFASFGQEYSGRETSSSYILFSILFVTLSLIIIFFNIVTDFRKKRRNEVLVFSSIPFVILLCYLLEMPTGISAFKYLQEYFIWGFVVTYIGINVALYGGIGEMAKYWFLLMLLITLGGFCAIFIPFLKGQYFTSFAGSSYQTASYAASLAYGLNLFFLLFYKYFNLPHIYHKYWFRSTMFLFLFLQILVIFISGGRGGFVVVFLSTIVFLYVKYKMKELNIKFFFYMLFSIVISIVLLFQWQNNELLIHSFNRVFSYISSDGIDMSQTSDRDVVYENALYLISLRPFTGYGIFKYFDKCMYPHNLFIELLLARGVFYLVFFLLVSFFWIKKLILIIKKDYKNLLLLPLFVFVFVQLMLSGTYLTTPFFWFLGSYVFCCYYTDDKEKFSGQTH